VIFDKSQVIAGVKMGLSSAEAKRSKDITLALGLCLDDMCMRLKSTSFLENTEKSLSAGDRTVTLTGANNDLRYIFHIKLAGSIDKQPLDRIDPEQFLKDYDDPSATNGEPEVYTVLSSEDGKPTVKFDRPLLTDDTLTVYYFSDMTPENISKARSVAAAVAGTLAWFHGIATPEGAGYYAKFEDLVVLSRASDSFESNAPAHFRMSEDDRGIYLAMQTIRSRRS
jgi:hypothetical protein